MNEISKILTELNNDLSDGVTNADFVLIKSSLIKAAFVAINDPGIAISVVAYVSKKSKEDK